jgi:hypothetical protein
MLLKMTIVFNSGAAIRNGAATHGGPKMKIISYGQ